ncbi:hypothetical protein Zmor_025525 [Zophobas morio]|uniref:Carboxylic ester hydrolase n=1 Tax=Zophobas morio TaxID=2755281 RepID=A0AA38HS24_9CUCU|nr:hypothetical protein Zmor_025525 [Zophobas morio]
MKLQLLFAVSFLLIKICYCCVFVKLDSGIIKGRIANIPNNKKTFYAFQEIPYAAPPTGNLRFQPPQEVPAWKGILDTTKNTKICYQISSDSDKETEDCLYLNVYTPQLPAKEKSADLPVMVYIHGGGYILGDATHQSYGPEFLVDRDVVVVTLNYRLGVFGFLSTQDEVVPGNNGLKDQLFALKWVQKNIFLFGGNASQVTIFGQSAGASSVGYHLISKKSAGLYRGAIMESSSVLSSFGYQRNARSYAFKTASYINSSITDESTSQDVLNTMLQATAEEIDTTAQTVVGEESYDNGMILQGYYYAPVIELESDDSFLTEKMFEIVKKGEASRVPVIIGINSEEGISQSTDLNFLQKLMSLYDNDLKALVPKDMNIESDATKTEAGERIRQLYSGDDLLQNVPAAGIRYMSDMSFTRSVIKFAQLQCQFSDVYFYQFSYDGKMGNVSVIVEGAERVGHNEENAYLWRISSDLFYNYDLSVFPDEDLTAQNRLLTIWTNFAKTLNPTPRKLDLLQNITWPTVQPDNDFPYLNIDSVLEVKNYPKNESFSGWEAIYRDFGVEPYDTY